METSHVCWRHSVLSDVLQPNSPCNGPPFCQYSLQIKPHWKTLCVPNPTDHWFVILCSAVDCLYWTMSDYKQAIEWNLLLDGCRTLVTSRALLAEVRHVGRFYELTAWAERSDVWRVKPVYVHFWCNQARRHTSHSVGFINIAHASQ